MFDIFKLKKITRKIRKKTTIMYQKQCMCPTKTSIIIKSNSNIFTQNHLHI